MKSPSYSTFALALSCLSLTLGCGKISHLAISQAGNLAKPHAGLSLARIATSDLQGIWVSDCTKDTEGSYYQEKLIFQGSVMNSEIGTYADESCAFLESTESKISNFTLSDLPQLKSEIKYSVTSMQITPSIKIMADHLNEIQKCKNPSPWVAQVPYSVTDPTKCDRPASAAIAAALYGAKELDLYDCTINNDGSLPRGCVGVRYVKSNP